MSNKKRMLGGAAIYNTLLFRRFIAAFIDFVSYVAFFGISSLISILILLNIVDPIILIVIVNTILFTTMVLLFCRDFSNLCIGKRAMGLKIISIKGGKVSRFKLMARNFTMVIWPAEVLALLVSKGEYRITDRILGLRVVERL